MDGVKSVSNQYLDFWTLLLNKDSQNGQEDLTKLNDFGSRINQDLTEIYYNFEKMREIKHTDQEALKLFSSFLIKVLNDYAGASFYKNQLNEIEGYQQFFEENLFSNADGIGDKMNNSDKNQYIVASAGAESFGTIVKITIGICSSLGYKIEELLGKDVNTIIPNIFQQAHVKVLQNKINMYKKSLLDEEEANSSEKHEKAEIDDKKGKQNQCRDIWTFAKNKTRYLVPVIQKVNLVPSKNEENYVFLSKIKFPSYREYLTCYILTNNNFIIQNYTANMISILNIDINLIELEVTKIIDIMPELLEFEEENTEGEIIERGEINKNANITLTEYLLENFSEPRLLKWKLVHYEGDSPTKFARDKMKRSTKKSTNKSLQHSPSAFVQRRQLKRNTLNLYDNDSSLMNKVNDQVVSINNKKVEINVSIFEEKMNNVTQGLVFKISKFVENDESKFEDSNQSERTDENQWINEDQILEHNNNTHINYNFVPDNNSNFILDPSKNSYFKNSSNFDEIHNKISSEAKFSYEKLKYQPEVHPEENNSEESEESETSEDAEENSPLKDTIINGNGNITLYGSSSPVVSSKGSPRAGQGVSPGITFGNSPGVSFGSSDTKQLLPVSKHNWEDEIAKESNILSSNKTSFNRRNNFSIKKENSDIVSKELLKQRPSIASYNSPEIKPRDSLVISNSIINDVNVKPRTSLNPTNSPTHKILKPRGSFSKGRDISKPRASFTSPTNINDKPRASISSAGNSNLNNTGGFRPRGSINSPSNMLNPRGSILSNRSNSNNNKTPRKSMAASKSSRQSLISINELIESNLNKIKNDSYKLKDESISLLKYDFKYNKIIQAHKNSYYTHQFDHLKDMLITPMYSGVRVQKDGMKTSILRNVRVFDSIPKSKSVHLNLDTKNTNNSGVLLNKEDGILLKQIEYSLAKNETQKSIIILRWSTFMMFILLLTIAIIYFYFFISFNGNLGENLNLIVNFSNFTTYNSMGVYYLRELSLLQNNSYTGYYGNKDVYRADIISKLQTTYNQNVFYDNDFMTSHLLYEYSIKDKLYNQLSPVYIQDKNKTVLNSTSNYLNFILETNAALYRITSKSLDQLLFNDDKDIFFYIYNSMNYLNKTSQDIFNELSLKYESQVINIRYNYLYIVLVFNIICISAYFVTTYTYNFVADKKESYLTVFFEIGDNVIKSNIESVNSYIKEISVSDLHIS